MTTRALLVASDGEEADLADQVRAGGGWIVSAVRPETAMPALADPHRADIIVADLRGVATDKAEPILDRLATVGKTTLLIVKIEIAQIDLATAYLDGEKLLLLADPDPIESAVALAVALSPGPLLLGEQSALPRLRELSEETGRIARALAELAQARPTEPQPVLPGHPVRSPIDGVGVRAFIRMRRLRERFFSADCFADPAWDILLDLYAAHLEGERVPVSSLCIAASVPPTTALRWIRALTEQGLLVRVADRIDRRRIFIALSDGAVERMASYFALVTKQSRP